MSQQPATEVTCNHGNECACSACRRQSFVCFSDAPAKHDCMINDECRCKEEVKAWGATYWWQQSKFWFGKYVESEDANKRLRGLLESQATGRHLSDDEEG